MTRNRRTLATVTFSAALLELLFRRARCALRVDLNHQDFSVIVGSGRGLEPLRGVTIESEHRSPDARLRRRPRKKVDEEAGHLLERHERAQSELARRIVANDAVDGGYVMTRVRQRKTAPNQASMDAADSRTAVAARAPSSDPMSCSSSTAAVAPASSSIPLCRW